MISKISDFISMLSQNKVVIPPFPQYINIKNIIDNFLKI